MWKNASRADWPAVALLLWLHGLANLPECDYIVHNKKKTPAEYRRHLRGQNIDEAGFLHEALAANTIIPPHVHCVHIHPLGTLDVNVERSHHLPVPSQGKDNHLMESGRQLCLRIPPMHGQSRSNAVRTRFPYQGDSVPGNHLAVNPPMEVIQDMRTPFIHYPPSNPELSEVIMIEYDPAAWMSAPTPNDIAIRDRAMNSQHQNSSRLIQGKKRKLDEVKFNMHDFLQPARMFQPVNTPAPVTEKSHIMTEEHNSELPGVSSGQDNELDNASRFLAACMAACMYGASGKYDLLTISFAQAASSIQQMWLGSDPHLLSAISTIAVWLRVYAEGSLPRSIFETIRQAIMASSQASHPIFRLVEWITAAAGGSLADCSIKSTGLREIRTSITETYSADHSNAIVASYCLGFQILLEGLFREAELHFQQLHETALRVLGPMSLQTVNTLTALSRAQSRQNKHAAALATIELALKGNPPGFGHPHRFELMYRKALICKKLGRTDEMLHSYCVVVEGRSATLGGNHPSTLKAYESLVKALQENGMWESHKDMAHRLLTKPQAVVTEEEASWRSAMLQLERTPECEPGAGDESEQIF